MAPAAAGTSLARSRQWPRRRSPFRKKVGVALTPAQAPGLALRYGDKVRVVVTPAQGDDLPAGTPLSNDATIVGVHTSEETGQTVVDLLVPKADAAVLATRIATGNIALVLDSRER